MQLAEPIASTGGFCVEGLISMECYDVDYASLTHSMQEQQTRMQALNSRAFTLAALHLPEHMVLAKLAGVIGVWTGRVSTSRGNACSSVAAGSCCPKQVLWSQAFNGLCRLLKNAQNSQQCWTMLVDEACASKSVDMIVSSAKYRRHCTLCPLPRTTSPIISLIGGCEHNASFLVPV